MESASEQLEVGSDIVGANNNSESYASPNESELRQLLRCSDSECFCHHPKGKVHCPAHRDWTPSLSLLTQDGKTTCVCHARNPIKKGSETWGPRTPKCSPEQIVEAIEKKFAAISAPKTDPTEIPLVEVAQVDSGQIDWNEADVYSYNTVSGILNYQVAILKTEGEKVIRYRCRKPTGEWKYNLENRIPVLYNLPNLVNANLIIYCQDEAAANFINRDLNLFSLFPYAVATTTPSRWPNLNEVDLSPLFGKNIVVFPNDDEGNRKHCVTIAKTIKLGYRTKIRFVELPDRGEGGGYVEFRKFPHTLQDALDLIKAARGWKCPEIS